MLPLLLSNPSPGWRNHPNFNWRNQGNQEMIQYPESKQPWEIAIEKLATVTMDRFEKLKEKMDQLVNHNKSLEMQLGQLIEAINSQSQDNLPSKTEVSSKEHCKAVTLRSGKQLRMASGESVVDDKDGDQKEVPNLTHEEQVEEKADQEEIEYKPPPVKPYVPPIPFP